MLGPWMVASLMALGWGWIVAAPLTGQEPLTRAERTGWLETSRYGDVIDFIAAVEALDEQDGERVLHATTFGYSLDRRPLPLVVVGAGLPNGEPARVRATASSLRSTTRTGTSG